MNYSSIHPTTIAQQKIYIDKKVIFIVLPDINLDIVNELYKINFSISNCSGIICPNQIYTIGRKKFNGKLHFLDIKKRMAADQITDQITKKIKVINNLTLEKDNRDTFGSKAVKYYYYDATIWSQAFQYMIAHLSERVSINVLITELSQLYRKIKSYDPSYEVDLLMLVKNQEGGLYNILKNIKMLVKNDDLQSTIFFDNFTLACDCENVTIPIIGKDKDGVKIIMNGVSKLDEYVEANTITKEINQSKEEAVVDNNKNLKNTKIQTLNTSLTTSEKPTTELQKINPNEDNISGLIGTFNKPTSFLTNLAQSLQTSTLVGKVDPESANIKVSVNQDELRKVLKNYKITDPDIIANVQTSLDAYIDRTKVKPTRDQAENIVLKAINFTIFGTDQVSDEYLHKPGLLFSKLKEIDYYKNDLNIPKEKGIIQPNDIIDLKYTTGQHRQKFEFEEVIHENMEKLFRSLEMVGTEYPIKVKKIEHIVEDNNSDRFIRYKVTLQNTQGGKKEPYDVELKVPSPVNDKYFKLHGNLYIMSNQQFLRPVTKTDKNEVRLLGSYGIVRVGLANTKFNPTNIEEIVKYASIRYPKLISKIDENSCEFSDGGILYFTGEKIYSDKTINIICDPDSGKLIDSKTKEPIKQERYEFLYNTILNKIKTVNPEDRLTKTKKALPYIWIYLGAIKVPLIYYLWSQKGLLSTLNDYGIDYEIVDTESIEENVFYVPTKDDKFLKITPKNTKEQFIVNGLTNLKIKSPIEDLNDPQAIYPLIAENYGSRALTNIGLISTNFVDPITKELLQFEGLPTNLSDLSSKTAVSELLNKKPDSLSDLKIYRSRLSEVMLNSVYKLVKLSHNTYKKKVLYGDDKATIFFDPEWIIDDLLVTAGVLQQAEPVSPVTEIMFASRVIKGGKGGVPSKRSFKKEHRNIHPSQYGNVGSVSTPEYVDVGLTCHHTLTPVITNKYGSYGAKDITKLSGWQTLALDEALTPFQNQINSDRLTLARTHANQVTPVSNSEMPLVCTGAEFIIPQLASSRFVHTAKKDGVISEVDKDKTITVKYKDGTKDVFDILPRLSRTKRGAYIALGMDTLEEGTKVEANQPIAFTKNFSRNGAYCAGKNVSIAIVNYLGFSHEDSYVLSKELADNTMTDTVEEVHTLVSPNSKIINIEKEKGKQVKAGDLLVEFSSEDSLEDYLTINNLDTEDMENETSTDLYSSGIKSIKLLAPVDGEIIDIKIFINNKKSTDNTLISYHNKLVKEQKELIAKLATTVKDKDKQLQITDNMNVSFMNIGGHKFKGAEFVGTRIVYYIKHPKKLNIGDKISNRFGAKGVVSKLLDPAPKGEFTKQIDCFISPINN